MEVTKIVITGGPCAGKSTALSKIQEEFEKMCVNENVKAYLDASNAFSNLINQVNSIIGYFVKGGDAGGCSGNCSGCSGCH